MSKKVKILDPKHPLFGKIFPLISIETPFKNKHVALVELSDNATLSISVSATDISFIGLQPSSKLTLEALKELVSLVNESEVLCSLLPKNSTPLSQKKKKSKL